MKKKIYFSSLIILLCSIIVFVLLSGFFNNEKYFNELIVDLNTYNSIKRELISKPIDDVQIYFEGFEPFYDKEDNRYYYSLVEDNIFSHNPKIDINNKYKIAIKDIKITDELISKNETINFLIYDDKNYQEFNLTCTTLPLMNIDYEGDSFIYDDQPMSMTLFDNRKGAMNRITESIGNVRLRGIFTAGLPKQGLRLTLLENDWWTERDEELLGLRRDGDWILYAGYNDVDKVRNVFCANLWNESCGKNNKLKANTGTEYKYLELFVNGKYYGLYALCYPIDAMQLNLKKGDGLYQPYMNEFEDEIKYENYYNVVDNMRLKYGDDWDILIDYYEKLFDSYWGHNPEAIKKIVDIDNIIDSYLFINFIQGNENANLYKIKNMKIGIKNIKGVNKCIYIPWDFDMAFGNSVNYDSKNNTDNYSDNYTSNCYHTSNPTYMLIDLGEEKIQGKLINRYHELRKDKWSNRNIISILDDYENCIYGSGAYYREMRRWPDGSYVESNYNLNRFKEYVINRLEYLDNIYQ